MEECKIADPIPEDRKDEFMEDPEAFLKSWPNEKGWTIKLLQTGEILGVHENTLEA